MKNYKKANFTNNIEQLRDTSNESPKQQEFIKSFADEFVSQIFGTKKFSGELILGEQIEIKKVYSGEQSKIDLQKKQLNIEATLLREEKALVEKKSKELKLQIEAIQVQTTKLVEVTPKLAREIQIAAFQAPTEVNMYELFFLEHIYRIVKSFTENIQSAHTWLMAANQRARRKGNVWGENYKKHGAKYLLSGEHYSGRSAA